MNAALRQLGAAFFVAALSSCTMPVEPGPTAGLEAPACGDGVCSLQEDCASCLLDCGACEVPLSCGNGACDPDETCTSCEADCGTCASTCGDGSCDETGDEDEDCDTCPADCGPCEGSTSTGGPDGASGESGEYDSAGSESSGSETGGQACQADCGGDCCDDNGTPGCDDAACQQHICDNVDAQCCESGWGQACANWAADLCSTCNTCVGKLENCSFGSPCCGDEGLGCGNADGQALCCLMPGEPWEYHPLECCSLVDDDEDGECD